MREATDDKDLQGLFGLKWNPFLPELPSEALFISPRIEHFGFRLEGKVREGGFASSPAPPAPASRCPCASWPSGCPVCATSPSV